MVRKARALSWTAFFLLYLGYLIGFGVRLRRWNNDVPGHCYDTALLALRRHGHPYADNIYLGVTGFYTTLLAVQAVEKSSILFDRIMHVHLASLQYSLHLYSVIAIRISNQRLLKGGSENTMGFGQLVALLMLSSILVACVLTIEGELFPFPPQKGLR